MLAISANLLLLAAFLAPSGDLSADLLAAVNKGDAAMVKALLAMGADVNAKNSYGVTALSFAADKGHVTVVKILLEHKADVNTKDSFYKSSPLDRAIVRKHVEIVKALVAAGAEGADSALTNAAAQGQTQMVQAILETGKLKEDALTKALAATPARHNAVAQLLKKAGAEPPTPKPKPALDPQFLAAYTGTYRSDNQE